MGKRTGLYITCLVVFPFAFASFVVGFGCPVWINNSGLWQSCSNLLKNCMVLDFDEAGDWMIGVRAVEIFALAMLTSAAVGIVYENCRRNFGERKTIERVIPGVLSVLGGAGGLSGIIVFTVKTVDLVRDDGIEYGWAMMLVSIGSGLATFVGVGFCVSGFCLENLDDPDKTPINAYGTPYLPPQGQEMHEMNSFTNKVMTPDGMEGRPPSDNHLPPYAYNNPSVQYRVLPPEPGMAVPSYSSRGGPPSELTSPQFYSYDGGDDRVPLGPQVDFSEGYLPSHTRLVSASSSYARDDGPYSRRSRDFLPSAATREVAYVRGGRSEEPYVAGRRGEDPYATERQGEDPYARGNRGDDPYNRARREEEEYILGEGEPFSMAGVVGQNPYPARPSRSGYPDSYRYSDRPGGKAVARGEHAGAVYNDAFDDRRDSFYRPGRF